MSKFLVLFLSFVFCLANVYAGGEQLKKKIAINKGSKNYEYKTLQVLQGLEKRIVTSPEDVLTKLDSITQIAIREEYDESLAYAYLLMGRAYKELNQLQLALHFMNLAQEKYSHLNERSKDKYESPSWSKKNGSFSLPDKYYFDMGSIYALKGDYALSTGFYKKYQAKIGDDHEINQINYLIADNYYAAEKFDAAIEVYKNILQKEEEFNSEKGIRECYSRLAACYISKGNTQKGLEYYNKSIQGIDLRTDDETYDEVQESKELVSKALRKQKKYKEDVQLRNSTLSFSSSDAAYKVEMEGMEHLRIAQSYYSDKNYAQAEASLDKYLAKPSFNLLDIEEIEVIKNMARRLEKERKPQKAVNYLFIYQSLEDTIQKKLKYLEQHSKNLGAAGYQNLVKMEVLQKDKEISQNMISHLMEEGALKEDLVKSQKYLIYLLSSLILIAVASIFYILRVSKQRRIANQKLALRSLRSQMNPHFIFNALNSVNSFISMNEERSANRFLSEFSRLMRTVMENSEYDFIPLSKELEILQIYIELEHFRFKDKFSYTLHIEPNIDEDTFMVPPMLIQPYIENAIWHGLRYRETEGFLRVSITTDKSYLKVVVEDNGIGRKKSAELKTKNQKATVSTALKNIVERIKIINAIHHIKIEVKIEDLNTEDTGTVVTLLIPAYHE